jgi:hypothetical protein
LYQREAYFGDAIGVPLRLPGGNTEIQRIYLHYRVFYYTKRDLKHLKPEGIF